MNLKVFSTCFVTTLGNTEMHAPFTNHKISSYTLYELSLNLRCMCNDGFSGDGTCEGTSTLTLNTLINAPYIRIYIYNICTIIQILMNAIWRLTNVLMI